MIVGLLLAAGGASRFGSQKLVALAGGVPLVRRAAQTLGSATDVVVVVVGNESRLVRDALSGLPAEIIENNNWQTGMASSVVAGVQAVPGEASALVVMLGDQPGVDVAVVHRAIEAWRATEKPIVVTQYSDGRGHPVLFARELFSELLTLEGDRGARSLIERSPDRVAVIEVDGPMPHDVDTREDLRAWTA